jgi:hypothetical protein
MTRISSVSTVQARAATGYARGDDGLITYRSYRLSGSAACFQDPWCAAACSERCWARWSSAFAPPPGGTDLVRGSGIRGCGGGRGPSRVSAPAWGSHARHDHSGRAGSSGNSSPLSGSAAPEAPHGDQVQEQSYCRDAGDQVEARPVGGEVAAAVAYSSEHGRGHGENEGGADLAGGLHQPGGEALLGVVDTFGGLGPLWRFDLLFLLKE